MSVRALGYIGIGVRDLKAWETFATSILGLQIGSRGDDGTLFLRMDENHHRIAVHPGGNDDIAYLGWEVANERALEALAEKLHGAGFATTAGDAAACRERSVGGFIACDDPAGIRCEFYWGALVQRRLAFVSPRGLGGFHTGDEGVGHVVVPDAAAYMSFYRDLLGFRISDFIAWTIPGRGDMDVAFLHCNQRHHSIAFNQSSRSGKRLSHFMVEVDALDDVGRTWSLCDREDVPMAQSLGRHVNDQMFSFYIVSPSGFTVEFGYGGRLIDDATWEVSTYDWPSTWGHKRPAAPAPAKEKIAP
jgi:3,4-dihydroxy-9,10-secoandrosta-1,3,5(10)-triene-9,17-dione 4,5-dioxygenase